jgi:hypothetical protein
MSINRTKRYLVLDSKNNPIRPKDESDAAAGLALALQKNTSPSHLTVDSAKAFAAALANSEPGERFYVAEILGVACVPEEPVTFFSADTVRTSVVPATLAGADLDNE